MRTSLIAAALFSSGFLLASAAVAQQASSNTTQPSQSTGQMNGASKQKSDDPTGQYNFSTPGGQYSNRSGAMRQRTEGEDVTGNNNFPARSK